MRRFLSCLPSMVRTCAVRIPAPALLSRNVTPRARRPTVAKPGKVAALSFTFVTTRKLSRTEASALASGRSVTPSTLLVSVLRCTPDGAAGPRAGGIVNRALNFDGRWPISPVGAGSPCGSVGWHRVGVAPSRKGGASAAKVRPAPGALRRTQQRLPGVESPGFSWCFSLRPSPGESTMDSEVEGWAVIWSYRG